MSTNHETPGRALLRAIRAHTTTDGPAGIPDVDHEAAARAFLDRYAVELERMRDGADEAIGETDRAGREWEQAHHCGRFEALDDAIDLLRGEDAP